MMARRKSKRKTQGSGTGRLHALAEQAQKQGKPKKAMQYLREAIRQNPSDAKAYFLLGNLFNQASRAKDAISCYDKSLALRPDNLPAQVNRANILQRLGQLELARDAYRSVVTAKPDLAVAYFNLGLVEKRLGNIVGSVAAFEETLKLQPQLAAAHLQLARIYSAQGRLDEASSAYGRAVKLEPDNSVAYCELGDVLQKAGDYLLAKRAYEAALKAEPGDAEAHYSLGTVQQHRGEYDEAIASYRRSIELKPQQLEAYAALGNTLHQTGRVDEAREQYRAALDIDPAFAHARLALCISQLPVIYRDAEQVRIARQKYSEGLDDLYEYYLAANQEERSRAASAVGFLQPFYLSYQGLSARKLQERYGALIELLMAARYPGFEGPLDMPPVNGKIRVGVVSGFLNNHSSWNIFQGLFEAIDRSRFELYMYHTRDSQDRETRLLRNLCDGFMQGPMDIGGWARVIREQRLHVLFFPEFGMDPTAIRLGCLRLAPIQMTSWGHPVTSGLSTIDYYLSSNLMEPAGAEGEYSETLVRLPNSSMHYRLPAVDPDPMQREDLHVPENSVLYWCCQSLFKYLPQHDDVFPRIAQRVDNALFIFLSLHGGVVEECFRERMKAAFAAAGLDADKHCFFMGSLPKPVFAAMSTLVDVFLDSIGWSGCNSSMEAIAADRPILTLPGEFMRGQHTKAFLEIMGLDQWIAADKDEYIDMAVRLGQDPDLRRSLSTQVRKRKHRLYRDPAPVRALEEFLVKEVSKRRLDVRAAPGAEQPEDRGEIGAPAPSDEAETHWVRGIELQRSGELQQSAAAFRRSLELNNPVYAAWEDCPQRQPDQSADTGDARVELNGLNYPAIPPVAEPRGRPFWSVVIPVYNRDQFLLECLASVLAQFPGEQDMEIIVIDNGSDPPLEKLVESIGKGIVRYHRHAKTVPLQQNWNSAISASRGYWVHLLHDDDYVLPGFYRRLQDGLADAPATVGAAFTGYENIREDGAVVFRNRPMGDQRGIADGWIEKIGVANVLNPPAVVVRRDSYERIGGYSDEILYTTDWELYLRLVSFSDWWYEPAILVHYRQHGFNVTTEQNRAGAQGEAFWRAIEMAEQYLPEAVRARISANARRYYFAWCLQRLRLPLQAGNSAGALRLLREMFRLDQTEESMTDAFDWLATTFAAPLWDPLLKLYRNPPADLRPQPWDDPGTFFDWLRSASAQATRQELAGAVAEMTLPDVSDRFQFIASSD
jgi:predicted O-linked N-acetylglucosamine transferase (SPINDLY family)/glycosyltransferase involved in cell wall biosynthesis